MQIIGGRDYYVFDVAIPDGRTGNAVLYTRWQRTDAAGEGFYSCSAITIADAGQPGFPWHESGYFVTQSFNPKAGDRVRFRIMSHEKSGRELVDEYLEITSVNEDVNVWARQLADTLNSRFPDTVRIGTRSGDDIYYDGGQVYGNRVYVKDQNDRPIMSIIPGDGSNSPPVAHAGEDKIVTTASIVDLDGRASSDPNGDTLTYLWTQTSGQAVTISRPNEALAAVAIPAVEQPTAFTFRLTVTDGNGGSNSDDVTVTARGGDGGGHPPYEPGKDYVGEEIVSHVGRLFQCKPKPEGGWCGQAPAYYEPGVGIAWRDAWNDYTEGTAHQHD